MPGGGRKKKKTSRPVAGESAKQQQQAIDEALDDVSGTEMPYLRRLQFGSQVARLDLENPVAQERDIVGFGHAMCLFHVGECEDIAEKTKKEIAEMIHAAHTFNNGVPHVVLSPPSPGFDTRKGKQDYQEYMIISWKRLFIRYGMNKEKMAALYELGASMESSFSVLGCRKGLKYLANDELSGWETFKKQAFFR